MTIFRRESSRIKPSEITDPAIYLHRRRFLKTSLLGTLGLPALMSGLHDAHAGIAIPPLHPGPFSTRERVTPFRDAAGYNNYYEFGTSKSAPARRAGALKTSPWTVTVEGACRHPAVYHLEDFIRPSALQERVYRHRCVEAWSMVIPWVGIPLRTVLSRCMPTANAKYVEFISLYDPAEMPEQRSDILQWPYLEGLRIDEAMHPLTLMAVGMYGQVLPNQNGAPLRLVVPWKYGFKSAKAIVKIRLVEQQPVTTWMRAVPSRYGFYSNVNPAVDRVPWSQRYERRIGDFFKRKTLLFNGYGNEVAHLYAGMNLARYY
ncbi:MAG: protein-methionine-sulfoxide reductase catalytic subunit MsrP [Acidiferrobacteraceae bacterium]